MVAKPNKNPEKQKPVPTPPASAPTPTAKTPNQPRTRHTVLLIIAGVIIFILSATVMYLALRLNDRNISAFLHNTNTQTQPANEEDTTIADVPSRKQTNTATQPRSTNTNSTGPATTSTADWETFSSTDYGFSLKHPKKWDPILTEINADNQEFLLGITPDVDNDEIFIIGRQPTGFDDISTVDEENVTIAGGTARKITAANPEDPNIQFVIILFDDSNPAKYQSLFITYAITTPTLASQYEKIVASLKIL